MITTLRITNIAEAKTAQKMIAAYLEAFGESETAPQTTVTEPKTVQKEEKVSEPVEKKKPVKKAPVKKKAEEPKQEEDEVAEKVTEALSLAAITAKAKKVREATDTPTVKAIIAKYTTGKLSTIKEEDYEAFSADLDAVLKG